MSLICFWKLHLAAECCLQYCKEYTLKMVVQFFYTMAYNVPHCSYSYETMLLFSLWITWYNIIQSHSFWYYSIALRLPFKSALYILPIKVWAVAMWYFNTVHSQVYQRETWDPQVEKRKCCIIYSEIVVSVQQRHTLQSIILYLNSEFCIQWMFELSNELITQWVFA